MQVRPWIHAVGLPLSLAAIASLAACSSSSDSTGTPPPSGNITLSPGARASAPNGQQVKVDGGSTGGEYLLVVTDTTTAATGASAFQVAASGIAAPGSVSAPSTSRQPSADILVSATAAGAPALDITFGARLNERFRRRFRSMMPAARQALRTTTGGALLSPSPRSSSISASAVPAVGSLVTYNVGMAACDTIVNHATRVVAVGTYSIIAVDTLDPPSGFTSADYQRFAANFDTLVYPLDVANFGAPSDIDQNGHVVLLFTRAVNELTPAHSPAYVGGFFYSRDLFPRTATASMVACAGSNVAEMFYLLAPDPTGSINGNIRTAGLIDSMTTSLVGHEFQHLINASRRLYVNNASDLEVVWLNEGLSHIAEELLFYRQSGLTPRQNITIGTLRTSSAAVNAFNTDQGANASRYAEYLKKPATSSPFRNDDSLSTRGATWDYLRYAADMKVSAGAPETSVWQALVNSTTTGMANLRGVFGADQGAEFRDWSVSHYTDDVTPNIEAALTQPSWNWHNLYPNFSTGGGTYPLQVVPLPTTGASASVIPGGSMFYRFAIPANTTAALTVSGGTAGAGLPVGTVVRLR